MAAPNAITNYRGVLDVNSKFSTANQAGYVPPAVGGLVAAFDFNAGDTTHMTKNGVFFEANADVLVPVPAKSLQGVPFQFTGIGNDLVTETILNRYFYFNEQDEAWVHQQFFVPPNYKHRSIHLIDASGDLTAWQIGDTVATVNGLIPGSTGTIYGKSGTEIKLEFSQNPYPDIWGRGGTPTTIINTTRSQTRTSVHQQVWSNNNKLFTLFCDDYSSRGTNPTVVFESHPVGGLYSSAYVHVAVDNNSAGSSMGDFDDFITAGQLGKLIDVCYGVKLSSALGVSDGSIEMWIKREGETSWTRKINLTNQPLWKRAGVTTGLRAGYLHGAQNSGYYVTTTLTDTLFRLFSARPSFLI